MHIRYNYNGGGRVRKNLMLQGGRVKKILTSERGRVKKILTLKNSNLPAPPGT